MIQAKVYNFLGQPIRDIKLDAAVFGVKARPHVIQAAVTAQAANAREVLAHTKDRSEVRGGGKKPWKQKGTGRARHGSSRSPIWIGGGVTFGPTKYRNFSLKINKQVKRSALRMVLSDKAAGAQIYLIDDTFLADNKTKTAQALIKNLKLSPLKPASEKTKSRPASVLVVLPHEKKAAVKAFKNLTRTGVIAVDSLNVTELMRYQYVVMPEMCVDKIIQLYGKK